MLLLQLLINGIQLGALYALTAGGFSLIFGATRIFHFAHGAAFMIAGYAFYEICDKLHLPWYVGLIVSASRHGDIRRAARTSGLHTHQASRKLVLHVVRGRFRRRDYRAECHRVFLRAGFRRHLHTVVEGRATDARPVCIAACRYCGGVAVLAFFGLHMFLSCSHTGMALRAFADSPELVRAYGMSPQKLSQTAFVLGSLLVVPAAILSGVSAGLNPSVGSHVMLISLAATIVGGVGSLHGAAFVGLLLGLAESLALGWFSSQWSEAIVFVVLFLFILFRPSGFFGRALVH